MQKPVFGRTRLSLIFLMLLIFIGHSSQSQNIPLINAFAHNDYWHKRPLNDALDNGFTHVEADIYLRGGKLIVAHFLPMFSHHHTLEKLYLKPLQARLDNADTIKAYPILLMIDIKSDANKTYDQLELLLDKYKPLLSYYENGTFVQKQLTIVLSGHKPLKVLKRAQTFVFLDDNLLRINKDTTANSHYQMASCKYSNLIKWNGKGDMPEIERQRLLHYVAQAHNQGDKVRLWASPEKPIVWKELLSCGVDLINTDKLAQLKNFLLSDSGKSSAKIN